MFTFYFCIFFYKKYCFICIPKIFLFFLLSETLYLLYMYSFLQKKSKLSLKSGDTRYVSFFVFYIFFKSNKHNNSYKNKIRIVEYKNRRILTCGGGGVRYFFLKFFNSKKIFQGNFKINLPPRKSIFDSNKKIKSIYRYNIKKLRKLQKCMIIVCI